MRQYLTTEEQQARTRIEVLQGLLAEVKVWDKPCPVLDEQLNQMHVLVKRLEAEVLRLQKSVATAKEA